MAAALVTRRGRLAGVFSPRPEASLPIELKRELFAMLSAEVARQIKKRGLKEEEILADFESYCSAHRKIDRDYTDPQAWARRSLRNIANIGCFSSDRTIADYVREIWKVKPYPVEVE